jgi:hypothetical protein
MAYPPLSFPKFLANYQHRSAWVGRPETTGMRMNLGKSEGVRPLRQSPHSCLFREAASGRENGRKCGSVLTESEYGHTSMA